MNIDTMRTNQAVSDAVDSSMVIDGFLTFPKTTAFGDISGRRVYREWILLKNCGDTKLKNADLIQWFSLSIISAFNFSFSFAFLF